MPKPEYKIDTVERLFGGVAGGNKRFQVRVRRPGVELWADAGEPCDTRKEAEQKISGFLAEFAPRVLTPDDEEAIHQLLNPGETS